MARTNELPRVLWLVTSAWLAGCGRVGFGALQDDPGKPLPPDGPVSVPDAAAAIVDAPPAVDAAPIADSLPAGTPGIAFVIPMITTTCGAGPTTVTAMVSNPGTADLTITSISLMGGDAFQVAGMFPMTIRPGESAPIQITALAAVLGTDRGGAVKTDKLLIDANVAANPVPISTTIMGANVEITVPSPPQLDFSDASGNCPPPQPATITNTGNLPVTVTVQLSGPFRMAGTSTASLDSNGVMTRSFRPFSEGICNGIGMINYQVTGASCSSSAIAATVDATFSLTGTSSCTFCS